MFKKIALGAAMVGCVLPGMAFAGDVRPLPLNVQLAVAKGAGKVKGAGTPGYLLPVLGGTALIGLLVAVAGGDGKSSPN